MPSSAATSPRLRLLGAALLGSLALNAALLLRSPSPAARTPADANTSAAGAPTPASAAPDSPAGTLPLPPDFAKRIGAGEPEAFRDLLVAAGTEPKLRRQLLAALLQQRFESRYRALDPDYSDKMQSEWWRNPGDNEPYSSAANIRRMELGQKVHQEFQAELARLTGEDPDLPDFEDNAWLARRFASLPREKAAALHRIERDYQELEQEIHLRSSNFQLPSDAEKLKLLHAERERDIAALLTPEEKAEWELRASPSADRARDHATRFKATEDEYRRIYALQKAFDDEFQFDPFSPVPQGRYDWQRHQAAEKRLNAEIRSIVGEERYAEAVLLRDQDYQIARAATERLGLPEESALRIHGLRSPAESESQRIVSDPALSSAQKQAALTKLAAKLRSDLERELGREAASAFVERGGMGWINLLENGSAFSFDPENGGTSTFDPPVAPAEPTATLPARVPVISID